MGRGSRLLRIENCWQLG